MLWERGKQMKKNRIAWMAVWVLLFFASCCFGGRKVLAADKVITDFSRIFYIPAGAIQKGQDLQMLRETYDGMGCTAYTEDGEELYLDVIWDYSGINMQTIGAYEITGTVKLPEGYTSKVSLPVWRVGISVQNQGQPELHVYSRMISAGIYYFPWITDQDPDTMEIWLKKEGEDWANVSEEGYGICDTDGMYLSCQSMVPGNVYTLSVTYNGGKTRNLTYRYQSDGVLDLISYQPGAISGTMQKDTTIRSCEYIDEKSLQRCMVYAVRKGQNLREIEKDLEETFYILGSTCTEYEDTAANPSVVLQSVWDFSQVDTAVPGVYKVTGTFVAPEGYALEQELTVPEAVAWITVQRPDKPEVQICYLERTDTLLFPMILDAFTDSQLNDMEVYLKESGKDQRLEKENYYFDRRGLHLGRKALRQNQEYGVYVVYPGGSTGIYTFQYNEDLITNEHWYERNYADRDGKDFPDIDNGQEKVTDTSTVLVGNRLSDLMSAGASQIPFEKDGVLIKIPSEDVKDWEVGADDEIQVDISKENEKVSIKVSQNGEEITRIPGMTIEVPYTSGRYTTILTDEDGNSYTGTENAVQGVAVIPVDKTGEYTVQQVPEENSQEKEESSDGSENSDGDENPEEVENLDATGNLDGDENLAEAEDTDSLEISTEELSGDGEGSADMEEKNSTGTKDGKLAIQHKKTAAIVAITAILLILLWYLLAKRSKKLRKGDRGEGEQGK